MGLDMSDGPNMGWYDSSRVLGGQDFQVDLGRDQVGLQGGHPGVLNESKVV